MPTLTVMLSLLLFLGAETAGATTLPRQQRETAQQIHSPRSLVVTTLAGGGSVLSETLRGVQLDAAGLPRCSLSALDSTGSATGCPRASLLARGFIAGEMGQIGTDGAISQPVACNPLMNIWNGGARGHRINLVVSLSFDAAHQCLSGQISTGAIPAFTATALNSGSGANSEVRLTMEMPSGFTSPLGSTGGIRGQVESARLSWTRGLVRD